jgi:hypothetical protein
MDRGYSDDHDVWKFSYYHIGMFVLFLTAAWPLWKMIPLMALIEDIFFFVFSKKKLNERSWICDLLGYNYLFGYILPNAYIFLVFCYVMLEMWL